MKRLSLLLALCLGLVGCYEPPEGLTPVKGFDVQRYLGRWYEIARLDHRFERGLSRVTATYSLNTDGSLRVLNRGLDATRNAWEEAEGRAEFTGPATTGSLKVSFFRPIYAGYHVLYVDPDYRTALVSGPDRDYFWILSRTPSLPAATRASLVKRAKAMGIATEQLIFVNHMAEPRPYPLPLAEKLR